MMMQPHSSTARIASRRDILLGGTAVAVAGGIPARGDARMTGADMKPLVLEWARLWTAHDADGLTALYTEDAVYEDMALRHKSTGRAELLRFFKGTFVTFPDFKMVVGNAVADDKFGSGEWIMSGTFLGESFGHPPTGKSFRVEGSCFMRFEGQRIRYHRDYWNEPTFSEQIAP